MIKALKQEVEKAFADIIEKYDFKVEQFDKYGVYLLGNSYAIKIILDRDGLYTNYYNLVKNDQRIYDYFNFLCDKRSDNLTFLKKDEYVDKTFIEQALLTLPLMARNIKNAGSDILAGD